MKIKLLFFSLAILLLISCEKEGEISAEYQIKLEGKLEKLGPTTYNYGTHKITYNNKLYALKSQTIDLNKYVNKKVTIWAQRISEGVERGPEYLEVKRLKK